MKRTNSEVDGNINDAEQQGGGITQEVSQPNKVILIIVGIMMFVGSMISLFNIVPFVGSAIVIVGALIGLSVIDSHKQSEASDSSGQNKKYYLIDDEK